MLPNSVTRVLETINRPVFIETLLSITDIERSYQVAGHLMACSNFSSFG